MLKCIPIPTGIEETSSSKTTPANRLETNRFSVPYTRTAGVFNWYLLNCNAKYAIYKRTDLETLQICYDVMRVRFRKERILNGLTLPSGFKWPSDEDFGKHAWSFYNYEKAFDKVAELSKEAKK